MPNDIQVGMPADQVRKLDGRARWMWTRRARIVGTDPEGPVRLSAPSLIVEWYYRDCVVVFKRRLGSGGLTYRVTEVRPKETKEARRARRHQARRVREANYA